MKIKIEKMGINGEGIGYDNRTPVFVDGALRNELVDINIIERKKSYAFGKLNRVISKSKSRVNARCSYQGRCGGCPLMIMNYKEQLVSKKDLLKQSLIKYAHVNPRLINDVIGCDNIYNYRNQCKLPLAKVDNYLAAGMYVPNSNYFVEIDKCIIHEKGLEIIKNQVLEILNKYKYTAYDYKQKKGIRNIIARGFDNKYQCTIVSGEHPLSNECVNDIMAIDGMYSLWQSYNTNKKGVEIFGNKMILLGGQRYLPFLLNDLKLEISPRSFFQLNTIQANVLYNTIDKFITKKYNLIVEAYSGIGAISLYLHNKANEIIGIESIKDAVINANANAKANKIVNVKFVCDDAANKLLYISKNREIDLLVVDPPRSGLDDNMLVCILNSRIKEIVYISCNPATLGKNLSVLSERYKVEKIQPVDMFPNTPHVECCVLLTRK